MMFLMIPQFNRVSMTFVECFFSVLVSVLDYSVEEVVSLEASTFPTLKISDSQLVLGSEVLDL